MKRYADTIGYLLQKHRRTPPALSPHLSHLVAAVPVRNRITESRRNPHHTPAQSPAADPPAVRAREPQVPNSHCRGASLVLGIRSCRATATRRDLSETSPRTGHRLRVPSSIGGGTWSNLCAGQRVFRGEQGTGSNGKCLGAVALTVTPRLEVWVPGKLDAQVADSEGILGR